MLGEIIDSSSSDEEEEKATTPNVENESSDSGSSVSLIELERPHMSRCVRRLPKVGQRINLSQYNTYFVLTKL
jgi:hypothetical protein